MRLAFAVAANLDPEILIVDEVLAVGDAQFQQKCLGKMQEVARHSGRTILFVSHNMNAVLQLCERAILLHQGQVLMDGPAAEVMKSYVAEPETGSVVDLVNHPNRDPSYPATLQSIAFFDSEGQSRGRFSSPARPWSQSVDSSLAGGFRIHSSPAESITGEANGSSPWRPI